jgi:TolB-like protein
MRLLILVYVFFIAGCQSPNIDIEKVQNELGFGKNLEEDVSEHQLYIHDYVASAALQLFDVLPEDTFISSIIVTSIVESESLERPKTAIEKAFSLQVQDSLLTLSTQAGFSVIEPRLMNQLAINETSETIMSRDVKKLATNVKADYVLAGTYTEETHGVAINLRLINLRSNRVVATATESIPRKVYSDETMVKYKSGYLSRG